MTDQNEKKALTIIFLLALLVSIVTLNLRYNADKPLLISQLPYYHGNAISQTQDFNPYNYILKHVSNHVGVERGSLILPIAFSVLSSILFFLILKKFRVNLKQRLISTLILIFSPIYVYTSSISSQEIVSINLIFIGFYLLISGHGIISIFPFVLIPFFNIFDGILLILVLFAYYFHQKRNAFSVLISIMIILSMLRFLPVDHANIVIPANYVAGFVSDFGSLIGLSVFSILLAIIGLISTWNKKRDYLSAYIILLFLTVSYFIIGIQTNIYLHYLIAVFAGIGFVAINEHKWQAKLVKNLTILILILGLIFSTVSYVQRIKNMPPDNELIDALKWLKQNSKEKEVVLSHYSNGYWIQYYSKRDTFSDLNKPKEELSSRIFHSQNLTKIVNMFKKHKIDYVFVEPSMITGRIWERTDQELLYILKNRENFELIHHLGDIWIWRFIGVENVI